MDDLLRPRLAAQRVLTWWSAVSDVAAAPPARSRNARRPSTAARTALATTTRAIDVDALTARLGLEVVPFHPATRRGGTLGWLEPGEDLIFLRDDLPEPVRRFTLAHELGHAVLHRAAGPPAPVATLLAPDLGPGAPSAAAPPDEPPLDTLAADTCDRADLDAPVDPLSASDEALRPGQAYSARAHRESEANAFAAALLLPPAQVRALYLGDATRPGRTPAELAAHFGVSEDAVHQALASLLLPTAEGDSGDLAPSTRVGGSAPRAQLDAWQQAAAAAETPALVVAGPGTGKTSTLVGRVAHLVFAQGVEPNHILALTFSNKAAQEMRERLGALLTAAPDRGVGATEHALQRQPVVSTIHAFCGDLLRRYAPLVGLRPDFRLIAEAEGYLLLRQVASHLALNHYQPLAAPALHFPALLAAMSRAKDDLVDPLRYTELASHMTERAQTTDERLAAIRALEVAHVYTAYQNVLAEAGDADFGDVIRLAVRLLREHREVLAELRARHTHILVDEFQDINHAMGVLLHTLAGPDGPLWVVGDADQAIYRFRGASPANLARFTQAYPTARVYALGANYRSRPPILRAAAAAAASLLGGGERTPLRAVRAEAPAPSPPATLDKPAGGDSRGPVHRAAVLVATAPDEAAELAGLAAAIRERVARGYGLTDQAVLCRTRRQCQRVAASLTAAGLPSFVVTPLLDQSDVKDVLSVTLLLADPSGAGLLRAGAVTDHAFSRSDAQVVLTEAHTRHTAPIALLSGDTLGELAGLSPTGRLGLARLGDALAELRAAPDVATGLARYVFAVTGLARSALAEASAASRLRAANLARLLVLARAFEEHRRSTEPVGSWPASSGAHWADFVDYVRVLAALGRESGRGAEDLLAISAAGVRVLTVHASKGLEFSVVYLPGMAEGRFPTQRRADQTPLPAGLSDDLALAARNPDAHRAEEACLFYVAITRARDELVLSHADRYGRRRYQPSSFLQPIVALAREAPPGVSLVRWAAAPAASAAPESGVADEDDLPLGAGASAAAEVPSEVAGMRLDGEALRPSAIETYQRCPRQYAYRYVYRLRPREIGLGTLRRGLHETLRDLQERFAASSASGGHPREPGAATYPTLAEAWALFEDHWRAAATSSLARRGDPVAESADTGASGAMDADGPFGALYRRHGRRVVERAWLDLLRERGLPVPAEADVAAESAPPRTQSDGGAMLSTAEREAPAGTALPQSAPLPLAARLEQAVRVRVGGRTIEVTLDRIDGTDHLGSPHSLAGGKAPVEPDAAPAPMTAADVVIAPAPAPVRFVRHRLGHGGKAVADLRSLLYALAAEQERGATQPELFQHNLTTGELERVRLDPRRETRLRDELAEALDGMESGVYPPRPEPMLCQGCPFLLICPA